MNYAQLLFSFNGRVSRKTFWLKFQLPLVGIVVLATILDLATGLYNEKENIGLLSGLLSLVFIYPYIAILVKRCHDRNRSGRFLLIGLIPLLNIWPWIELYFFKGTPSRNQYGEEPLS